MKTLFSSANKSIILMMSLFVSLTLITSCGDDGDDPIVDPMIDLSSVVASFAAQVDADNSLTYSFTNNSVVNGIADNTFDSSWDFGSDGSSTDASPSHTFSAEGSYDVTLTVTASDGVVGTSTEIVTVTAPKNRYAVITDSTGADNGNDTGELRLAVDSIQNGRITFMFRVAEGPVDMDIQDAFINVTGTSTSGKNSIVEVRFKDNAKHEFREGASDATIADADFPEGMPETWEPVEVIWSADGTNAPVYTVSVAGQIVITDAVSTTRDPNDADMVAEHLETTIDGAHNFQWKYASNGTISDGVYHVDDIVVYSSDSGAETEVFSDNFQGRVAGDDLNPENNMDSPYHENSADATVGEDQ